MELERQGFRKDFQRKTTWFERETEETEVNHGVHPQIPLMHRTKIPDLQAQAINTERAGWEYLLDCVDLQHAQNRLFHCKSRESVNSKMMCRPLAIDYVAKTRLFFNKWHGESKTFKLGAFLHAGDYRRHWKLREEERQELDEIRLEHRQELLKKTEAERTDRIRRINPSQL